MICVCFCNQPLQQGWQISLAIRCPSSLGSGANPSAGRFSPQCLHLISSAMIALLKNLSTDYELCPFVLCLCVDSYPNSIVVIRREQKYKAQSSKFFMDTVYALAALIALIVSSSLGRKSPSGRMSLWRRIPFGSITNTDRATLPGNNDLAP